MNDLNLPLTPIELEKCLQDIIMELKKRLILNESLLTSIYTNFNKGSDITSILSPTAFNELFTAINTGYEISVTGNNKYFKILYADTEEITSDNYCAVKIVFIKDNEIIKFVFAKFDVTIYLDTKTVEAVM